MACAQLKASAPASIMLFGEHAVLHGGLAIACALSQRIFVELKPRNDNKIVIESAQIGSHYTTLETMEIIKPFEYVLASILYYKDKIKTGFDLQINSGFSDKVGLGSSAAVTVATLSLLASITDCQLNKKQLLSEALAIYQIVQGVGSGTDLATSIFGGVIAYKQQPLEIDLLPLIPDLNLIYCGYKTPTVKVINLIKEKQQKNPELYEMLYAEIHATCLHAKKLIATQDWQALSAVIKQHQSLQAALGTSDAHLDELIDQLNKQENVRAVKISGSGLGDSLLAFGSLTENFLDTNPRLQEKGVALLPCQIDPEGVRFED